MRLVPSTPELVRAEIHDHGELARLLDARVPPGWPPGEAADALPWFLERLTQGGPEVSGWYGYYGIVVDPAAEPDAPVLVGGGGTVGPPEDGTVEIGYSLMPAFEHRGYATEMMARVLEWLAADPRIERITAETVADNAPSQRVLARLGFQETGPGRDPGSRAFA
ncbi:MAG TPA: GNAT family N-acetyltransferase, partial [Candidatus Limnocylindrales bacterium]